MIHGSGQSSRAGLAAVNLLIDALFAWFRSGVEYSVVAIASNILLGNLPATGE
jgi:hypothetical protein